MNSATFFFGLIIAILIGALFHLWRDGGFWRLLLYLVLSIVGFFGGHFLFSGFNFILLQIGGLNLLGAFAGSLAFLFLGHWLSAGNKQNAPRR